MHDGSKTASLKRNEVKMLLLSTSRPHVTLDGPSKRVVFPKTKHHEVCEGERERSKRRNRIQWTSWQRSKSINGNNKKRYFLVKAKSWTYKLVLWSRSKKKKYQHQPLSCMAYVITLDWQITIWFYGSVFVSLVFTSFAPLLSWPAANFCRSLSPKPLLRPTNRIDSIGCWWKSSTVPS